MRWRFWRLSRRDAALFERPLAAAPTTAERLPVEPRPVAPGQAEPAADRLPAAVAPRRPVPAADLPELPNGPGVVPEVPLTSAPAVDEVVRLVRLLVAREPVAPGAPVDERAAPVAVTALALRLPAPAGITGSVADDPDARSLLLAYADLLAGRAEPLRRQCSAEVPGHLLRSVAREACGEPVDTADVSAASARDRLLAACVLLAQTCADGAPGPAAIPAELAQARRA